MPLKEIVDEVPDDAIGSPRTSIDDSAEKNVRIAIPLDIESTLPIGLIALDLCPAVLPTWLLLLVYLKAEFGKLGVIRDYVAKTFAFRTHHLNECLHMPP